MEIMSIRTHGGGKEALVLWPVGVARYPDFATYCMVCVLAIAMSARCFLLINVITKCLARVQSVVVVNLNCKKFLMQSFDRIETCSNL
ncbi:hypothetical protein GCM10023078_30890 [Gibbsiella greigii]